MIALKKAEKRSRGFREHIEEERQEMEKWHRGEMRRRIADVEGSLEREKWAAVWEKGAHHLTAKKDADNENGED